MLGCVCACVGERMFVAVVFFFHPDPVGRPTSECRNVRNDTVRAKESRRKSGLACSFFFFENTW